MKYHLQMVGTDAELFLRHRETLHPVPVIGLLGGTKMAPKPVKKLGAGFAVQEDNVMAEFNVPPAWAAEKFSENIGQMLEYLQETMAKKDLDLVINASLHFNPQELLHPQAATFGCDPDICAWTSEYNEVDRCHPSLTTMRTAAAHIHVSYLVNGTSPKSVEDRELAVRAHDLFVGVPSILLDKDTERRQIYGKAGAYRITPYGHEYRTPSNFWIRTDKLRSWIFTQTQAALSFASHDAGANTLRNDEDTMLQIQECINTHNPALADWLCQKFNINFAV